MSHNEQSIAEQARRYRVKNSLWDWHTDLEKKVGRRISVRSAARSMELDERTLASWLKGEVSVYDEIIMIKVALFYGRDLSELFSLCEIDTPDDEQGQSVAVAAN